MLPSQVRGGSVKAFGVSSTGKIEALPEVPAAKDGGVNFQMSVWSGIFAPKGTSKEAIGKLASALDKALDDPSVVKRLTELGGSIPVKAERIRRSSTSW